MDGDRVITVQVEDTDLKEPAIGGRADKHGEVFAHVSPAYRITSRMIDIVIGHTMLLCRNPDPHLDNIPCLSRLRNEPLMNAYEFAFVFEYEVTDEEAEALFEPVDGGTRLRRRGDAQCHSLPAVSAYSLRCHQ